MERVVVFGRGGAGKSVLARELGIITGLPVVELDKEFWSDELKPLPAEAGARYQAMLAQQPRWIIEGDLGSYDDVEPRLRRADTVVVLDMPLWRCMWRAWRRGPEGHDSGPGRCDGGATAARACWARSLISHHGPRLSSCAVSARSGAG